MLFNSFQYVLFLPLVMALGWVLRHRVPARNAMLLGASYLFYGEWDWRFLGLLIASTLIDYSIGRLLGPVPAEDDGGPQRRRRKRLVAMSCLVNLGILGFFKYFDFFVGSTARVLDALGLHPSFPMLHVILPVGISFYTFQSMSYTIDVYRGRVPPERSLLNFAVFVAFFPQLVAGPIERSTSRLPQISTERHVRREDLYCGFHTICWGLFKKVVLADNAALIADKVFEANHAESLTTLIGTYAFAIQIYCDFSGYTDIARGSARLLGFDLMQNFDHPYFATNPSDFWRRWHISLSTWLRDYLYIPLGGNRKSVRRTYLNLMVTMALGGLWHGAAWTFVCWGLFHGALLCLHRALSPWMGRSWALASPAGWLVRVAVYFQLTCLGWLLFRADTLPQVAAMLGSLAHRPRLSFDLLRESDYLVFALIALTLLATESIQFGARNDAFLFRWPIPARAAAYALAFLLFVTCGNFHGFEFIYFQF